MKKINIIIHLIGATMATIMLPVTSCNKNTPVPSVDFLTCSWTEINTWCEKLEKGEINEKDFCSHFTLGDKATTSLSDFNGVDTRTITINKQTHYVRIIGQQHDTIADGSLKGKKATFTFELKTLLSQESGYAYPSAADFNDNYNYPDSLLRKNLTGNDNQASWGVPEIEDHRTVMQMLPSEIKSIIKNVTKKIATSTDSGINFKVVDYVDKLFILTRTEMGQEHEEGTYWMVEGQPYEFWINNEKQTEEQARRDGRGKMDAKHNGFGYWLSTPITTVYNDQSYVANDGIVGYATISNAETVTFAFCI